MKRFFVVGLAGSLATTFWAIIIGAAWGILIRSLAGPARDDFSDVQAGIFVFSLFSIPVGFITFGVASIISHKSDARLLIKYLVRCSVIRSLQCAGVIGLIGAIAAVIIARTTDLLNTVILPKYLLGLGLGIFLGFVIGLIWGVIAGARTMRRKR